MLRFEDVTFRYEGEDAPMLEGLSFHVARGEFVSLIGASGCGKSTIFRLASGLLQPASGKICAGGTDIAQQKRWCGYMPQSDLLFPWRTVGQNLRLPLEIRGGFTAEEMEDQITDTLKTVGLADCRDKRPGELSGGMRQRAAFARTLLTGSDLLLLDEPFSALDFLTRVSMREWLLDQWERSGKTILFGTPSCSSPTTWRRRCSSPAACWWRRSARSGSCRACRCRSARRARWRAWPRRRSSSSKTT